MFAAQLRYSIGVHGYEMKIVIISDLHSNWDALSALPEKGDELWVLGDLVNYGPQPSEVVDYVLSHASVAVRGNHDHSVGHDTDPRCTPSYARIAEATRQISLRVLSPVQKRLLHDLPTSVTLDRESVRFYLCHARPSDPLYGYCPAESDEWREELEDIKADVLLVGHTHTPFIRNIGNQVVVNPGSLGQPKTGKPDACYATWEDGQFLLKSFPYPVDETKKKINQLALDEDLKQKLINVVMTGSI
jgi:putative phosphoesterase